MSNNIHKAFNHIKAEDQLKANTLNYIREKTREKSAPLRKSYKFIYALASFAVVLMLGIFSYSSIYNAPIAYVDLDINPAIELSINRFDRVIGVYAYNRDGEDILASVDVKNKTYEEAMPIIIEKIIENGKMNNDGQLSVTVQNPDGSKQETMLSKVKATVEIALQSHNCQTGLNIYGVDAQTREHAHDYNISPAKYLAIKDLQSVDPTVEIEECADHTIGEIKKLTEEHGGNHHNDRENKNESPSPTNGHNKQDDHDGSNGTTTPKDHESGGSQNTNIHDKKNDHNSSVPIPSKTTPVPKNHESDKKHGKDGHD